MTTALRVVTSTALSPSTRQSIRHLMDAAFDGEFSDDDFAHALGGWHALVEDGDTVVAHASAVPRVMVVDGVEFESGYVEAVAVRPALQGTGLGTLAMRAITDAVREHFALGVLSTGERHFYERLGWERWRGPAFVRHPGGRLERVPDEDDAVMVLRFGASAGIGLDAPIACDDRPGDAW